jgi:hypothetical protein
MTLHIVAAVISTIKQVLNPIGLQGSPIGRRQVRQIGPRFHRMFIETDIKQEIELISGGRGCRRRQECHHQTQVMRTFNCENLAGVSMNFLYRFGIRSGKKGHPNDPLGIAK